MNDVVSTFPLLRLPKPAILNTMRIINHLEIFGISILSKKATNLMESLKVTASAMSIFVTDVFGVSFEFGDDSQLRFNLYQNRENETLQELEMPGNVHIRSVNTSVLWTSGISVKELIYLLKHVFHTSIERLYFGPNCERFSLDSIHKTVGNFRFICLVSGNHEHNRRISRFFQPTELSLVGAALDDGHVPKHFSIQNFDDITVLQVQINLNNLLIANTQKVFFECIELSTKILIQFLKLWMKGSNLRLEWAFFEFPRAGFQIDDVLKTLNHKVAPLDRLRFFKYSDREKPKEVVGGWDVWRFDGTHATITFRKNDDFAYFHLFVWHDHCVVN